MYCLPLASDHGIRRDADKPSRARPKTGRKVRFRASICAGTGHRDGDVFASGVVDGFGRHQPEWLTRLDGIDLGRCGSLPAVTQVDRQFEANNISTRSPVVAAALAGALFMVGFR